MGTFKLSAESTTLLLLLGEGRAGSVLKETLGVIGLGQVVLGDVKLGANAMATWPEIVGGDKVEYNGMLNLTSDESEVLVLNSRLNGALQDVALDGDVTARMRVNGNNVLDGSGRMRLDWSQGLQLDTSVSNGPSVVARVSGNAKVHGGSAKTVGSFMQSYMQDQGRMDFGMAAMILNVKMLNLTGSLVSSDMRAGTRRSDGKEQVQVDVSCLRLDAGGVLLGDEDDNSAISSMRASSDLRFTDFSGSLWDATVEHAMIHMSMMSFEDTITETSDAFEEPPHCSMSSSGDLSFDVGELSDFGWALGPIVMCTRSYREAN